MGLKRFLRGIRDLKIATWNSEGSWGTAYDVLGARAMAVELVVETDELRGDDVVLDRYSKIVAATFRVEHASVDLEVGYMMTGGTFVSNADYEDLLITEESNIPYLGIAGRVVGSQGNYDVHIFAPKAKIAGNLALQAQVDTYMIPQAEFQAVSDGDQGIVRLRNFTALTALEIPLRTSTGGL